MSDQIKQRKGESYLGTFLTCLYWVYQGGFKCSCQLVVGVICFAWQTSILYMCNKTCWMRLGYCLLNAILWIYTFRIEEGFKMCQHFLSWNTEGQIFFGGKFDMLKQPYNEMKPVPVTLVPNFLKYLIYIQDNTKLMEWREHEFKSYLKLSVTSHWDVADLIDQVTLRASCFCL